MVYSTARWDITMVFITPLHKQPRPISSDPGAWIITMNSPDNITTGQLPLFTNITQHLELEYETFQNDHFQEQC
jgi:hypothetical protein